MSENTPQKGKILAFPSEVSAQTWMDELMEVIDRGHSTGVVASVVGFVVLTGGETGFHIGNVDTGDTKSAYLMIGAIEEMKARLMKALLSQREQ